MISNLKELYEGDIVPSALVGRMEFLKLTGCGEDILADILDLAWISPVKSATEEMLFNCGHIYKVRKLMRICKDFDISVTAGVIIVDLLQRVDELEEQVRELSSGRGL